MSQKTTIKPARLSVALLASSTLVAIVAQLFVALPSEAKCEYAGEIFETGQRSGPLVCMPNGEMEPG